MCIWVCVCVCVLKWCLRHCPNGTYLIFGSGWKCMIYYKVYAAWPYVGALRYMRPLALKDQIPPFCPLQSSSEFLRFRLQWWLNPPFHCLSFVCFHSPPGFVITHSLIHHSLSWSWLHYLPIFVMVHWYITNTIKPLMILQLLANTSQLQGWKISDITSDITSFPFIGSVRTNAVVPH